ncbi:hypothetical protein D3C79_639610 [compost metagenome]
MGSGAHLVGSGGDLIDFAELHLHTLAGALGNGRRLVCSAAGLGDALLDLGDGRLQLVEETVEAAGQPAEFVLARIAQALGEVAVAAGDVFEHAGHAVQRAGHTGSGQPHQQQAAETGQGGEQHHLEGATGAGVFEGGLQAGGVGQQYLLGQVDQNAPGLAVGNRLHRVHGADGLALLKDQRLIGGQLLQRRLAVLVDALADLAGIVAVGRQQAAGGDDHQAPGAIEQLLLGFGGSGLKGIEGNINASHGDHLAVVQQGHGDAGHQHLLAADGVGVGLEQAGAGAVARAGVPDVVRRAAEVDFGLVQVGVADHRVQGLALGAAPVTGEAAALVAQALGIVGKRAVATVQAFGLECQPHAQYVGVALEAGGQALVDRFTQVASAQAAIAGQLLQVLDLVGEGGDDGLAVAESTPQHLGLFAGAGL